MSEQTEPGERIACAQNAPGGGAYSYLLVGDPDAATHAQTALPTLLHAGWSVTRLAPAGDKLYVFLRKTRDIGDERVVIVRGADTFPLDGDPLKQTVPALLHDGWTVRLFATVGDAVYLVLGGMPSPAPVRGPDRRIPRGGFQNLT
jgi:hypothetical protein